MFFSFLDSFFWASIVDCQESYFDYKSFACKGTRERMHFHNNRKRTGNLLPQKELDPIVKTVEHDCADPIPLVRLIMVNLTNRFEVIEVKRFK